MTEEPQNFTTSAGRGRLLSSIIKLAHEAKNQRGKYQLTVGSETRLMLDRITGNAHVFMGFLYHEDPKLDPFFVELQPKKEPKK